MRAQTQVSFFPSHAPLVYIFAYNAAISRDEKQIVVIAHLKGMAIKKQELCRCTYNDTLMMKDLNPAAFYYDFSLRCLDLQDVNRKERHGETKPNGPGAPVQYCEALSSAVIYRNGVRYHIGVSRPGSYCFRSSYFGHQFVWFRAGEGSPIISVTINIF